MIFTKIHLKQVRFGGRLKHIPHKFALTLFSGSSLTSIQVLTSHDFTQARLSWDQLYSSLLGSIHKSLIVTCNQRIGIKIEANANLYVVGIATCWQIPRQFLYSISLPLTLPLPLQTYIARKRDLLGGGDTEKCMPRNPSIGCYSDDVKVCIGFYLNSYSLPVTNCAKIDDWISFFSYISLNS
jgi:hypothetical protein